MQNIFILLFVFKVLPFNEAYNLSCPTQGHWNIRAKSMCFPPEKYTCLYNVTFQVNVYRERCMSPRIIDSGYKLVFQPNPNNATCRKTRYQPFIFETIGYSDCAFQKIHCNGEGQTTYGNGNPTSDKTCICNTDQGYTFVVNSTNRCFCNPATEDCSCYFDNHSNNGTTGMKDLNCYGAVNTTQIRSGGEPRNESEALKNNDDLDNYKYNISPSINSNRTTAATIVSIVVLLYIPLAIGIYILRLVEIETPENVDIVDFTDRSLSVKWYMNDSDNSLEYQLDHRILGSDEWISLPLSSEQISTNEDGCLVYKLQELLHDTFYEVRMCSVYNHVKSKYTEPKTQKTLQLAPANFDIVDFTDRSLSVKWYMNDSDNSLEYQLDHRILGSDGWISLPFSSEHISTNEDGCQVYKLQELLHDTFYEVRMCSVNNHVKSKYTESKTQKTLQLAPENFDIVDFTDRSLSVKWYMNDSDNSLVYQLDHRILGSDEWISLPLSSEHISTNEDGCHVYKLQELLSETFYEVIMCSINNLVKSKYTEPKTQKTLQLAPENFDIVDFTDRSLSVKWYMNDSDNSLEYQLDHRILGSDEWISLTLSSEHISTNEDGCHVYKLQELLSETFYEVIMCSVNNHVKSKYTEPKTQKTLQLAPENFDIVDFTDRSLSVKWYMNDSDNSLEYQLDHRILGSDAWISLTLSSEHISTNEDGCQVYKLQELLHETFYEVRMCSVNNHFKSKYTELRTQKTLQIAPTHFEIVECTDRSISVEWDIHNSDICLEYKYIDRHNGSKVWKEKLHSPKDFSTKRNGRYLYKLEKLSPDTLYELKLCYVDNHQVKSLHTEPVSLKTLKVAPKNFEVVECTDHSITVKWDSNDSDNCLEYKRVDQLNGSDDCQEKLFSTKDVSTKENGCYVYKLQNLSPDTCYQLKLCSVDDHQVRSQHTENQTRKTLKMAPQNFDIIECSDRSITVKWYMNDLGDLQQYELNHRLQGSDNWNVSSFSLENASAEENASSIYKLENLSPGTCYELKMCSVQNNVRSEYSKNKLQQTLKIALPEAISRLEEKDRNRYMELMQSSQTEKRYFVRIMIVGKKEVGKTCLLRRLLKENIKDVSSTDGIDIVVRRCKIDIEDGKWTIGKDITDDRADRFQRAMKQSKILENDTAFRTESTENETNEINFDKPNTTIESNFTETENENASKLEVTKSGGQDDTKRNNNQLSSIESNNEVSKKDVSTEVSDNSNVMSDQVNVPESHQEIKHLEFEAENHNDKGGNRKTASSDIEHSSTMDDTTNSDVEEVIHIDIVSVQTKDTTATIKPVEIIESMENNSESKDHVNEYATDKKSSSNNNEKENTSSSLVMPKDLMSRVFHTTSTSDIPTNICAVCGLWDFAGQKEFYATHQAFLTGSALYLVVADITEDISKQDIKPCFADFQNVGEYVDFWFDNIHCHRTVEPPVGKPINYPIGPPIILVFTGKDKLKKEAEISRTTKKLNAQLDEVFGMQSKYHHLQHICYVSNTNDPDEEFEKLRQEISAIAMKMKNWGEYVPLKWILLEHLIEINREDGKNFINLDDITNMAKHSDINILDIGEVFLFLRFQHEVGNIIFFEDIQDLIILNPQWLVDAFRCLVSDKIHFRMQAYEDWTQLLRQGQISDFLITELFKSKCGIQYLQLKEDLLKVMVKLDILVKIGDKDLYMMPSMMPSLSFDKVCEKIGIWRPNCTRTSWFCLKFAFLPPAFFNHLSVWFIQNYNPTKMVDNKTTYALYRGICVFDKDSSRCDKILVTMSSDTIAIQIVSFSTETTDLESICSDIRGKVISKIKAIKARYKLNINYELHFKCSSGHYHKDTMSLEALKASKEYFCNEHMESHKSELIYLPWMNAYAFTAREIRFLRIVVLLHVAEDAVRIIFDYEFHPKSLYKWIHSAISFQDKAVLRRYMTNMQWKTLFYTPANEASSRNFDLHMMLCLLKTIVDPSISTVCNGMKTSQSSYLSRIWYCSSQMSKYVNCKLAKENFNTYWEFINESIIRLDQHNQHLLTLKCLKIENCDLDDTSTISQKETRCLRILHFILHVAREVVQQYFDRKFPPYSLQQTIISNMKKLNDLETKQKLISKYQWSLLFSYSGKVSSASLDIQTMVALLKHLTDIRIPDRLSRISDNGSYLSRIWWYCREVKHCNRFTMYKFEERWYDISDAVIRLGGERYIDICKRLKTAPLYASEL